ncbi:MAG TPA: DinB family protein [Actinomycetota bacterium]
MSSPDPVNDPQAYQQHLLGLLGDDDPAVVQAATPAALRALVAEAGEDLRRTPEPGEWSVFGCLAHLVDAELVMSGRYRWVIAHDDPPLIGYDQDLWVDRLHSGTGSTTETTEELLAVFVPLREANLALWARTPEQQRARAGTHAERGPESYDLAFKMIAGHDRFHVAQAERALKAVQA